MATKNSTILITGGSGYIGTSVAYLLRENGYRPVLFDNFSTSKPPIDSSLECVEIELTDRKSTEAAWKKIGTVHGVLHFAARALVPESVKNPYLYFYNNSLATLNVTELCTQMGTQIFVHSSSCAVYGVPKEIPITEASRYAPVSPYGESKVISERILAHYHGRNGLRVLNLRYFNPSGALTKFNWGERHDPETHVVPNLIRAALHDKPFSIFGEDYPTADGTCVRDFIHIEDLAMAHILALEFLARTQTEHALAINLGGGQGTSVRQLVKAAEEALGKKIQLQLSPRREGDPPVLFADITLARKLLGFQPKRTLREMLVSHFQWAQTHLK